MPRVQPAGGVLLPSAALAAACTGWLLCEGDRARSLSGRGETCPGAGAKWGWRGGC